MWHRYLTYFSAAGARVVVLTMHLKFVRFIFRLFLICQLGSSEVAALAGNSPDTHRFLNPVAARGQDPWVIRWQTNYFFCQSRPDGVWVNQSARLEDIGQDRWKCVWRAPADTAYARQIWAPE